jgi:hypothetical protein
MIALESESLSVRPICKMKLKRYDIKKLLSDPVRRRMMIANSTVVTMAREGIDITLEQALASYDEIMKEKRHVD